MTIKHVSLDGNDVLYETKEVSFTQGPPRTVWIKHPDNRLEPLTGGHAYVMNDSGATVARYALDLSPDSKPDNLDKAPGIFHHSV